MRDNLFLLLFCYVFYPSLLAGQPAAVDGTVVNSATGTPLSRVHLRLALYNPDEVVAPIYGAISDDAGRFSMAGVQPGVEYRLEAERAGFLLYPTVEQAPRGIILRAFKPGERAAYRLEMAPRVVISGRVVDEYGEPMPDVTVVAQRVPQASPTHSTMLGSDRTDDRGMFRLAVAPEHYYVAAFGPGEGAGVTYYPNALTRESATVLEARAGSDIGGIDIRARRSATLSISGTVAGIPPGADRVVVTLRRDAVLLERPAQADSAGRFAFSDLEPGVYRMYARCCMDDEPLQSQPQEIALAGANRDFISLTLTRGVDLEGTLVGAPAREIRVMPVRMESESGMWG